MKAMGAIAQALNSVEDKEGDLTDFSFLSTVMLEDSGVDSPSSASSG